jgi:ElaB/YqjD/DUF883 family membrane-anchored ribosome-binding protein
MGIPQTSEDAARGDDDRRLREFLVQHLRDHGLDPESERSFAILQWLEDDIESIDADLPNDWKSRLCQAMESGMYIYDAFMEKFSEYFQSETTAGTGVSTGETAIRGHLSRRFPTAYTGQIGRMTEGVLNIILNKRLYLLDHAYQAFQKSLFAKRLFERKKLPGFLVRVARIESYKVPPDLIVCQDNKLPDGAIAADDDPRQSSQSLAHYVPPLRDVWSSENCFNSDQQREGLASSGFAEYVDDSNVTRRAQDFRDVRLAVIEEETEKINRKIGQELRSLDEVQEELWKTIGLREGEELRRSLEEIEQKLTRLNERLAGLRELLQPKPREVAWILDVPIETVRHVRAKRIAREIVILKNRVEDGIQDLQARFLVERPNEVKQFLDSVANHLNGEPASRSAHNLSKNERNRREKAYHDWEQRGMQLTDRVSEEIKAMLCGKVRYSPPALHEAILECLVDVEDYYQFGLTRKGIIAGLGHRQGWRLDHLLRTS